MVQLQQRGSCAGIRMRCAWIRMQLPGIVQAPAGDLPGDLVPGEQLQQLPGGSCRDPDALRGILCAAGGLQRLRKGSGGINTRAEAHRAEMRPCREQQRGASAGIRMQLPEICRD